MATLLFLLLLSGPVIWAFFLVIREPFANRHREVMVRGAGGGTWCAMAAAVLAGGEVLRGGPIALPNQAWPIFYVDTLSAVMASLIGFIGWVIVRYARTYLAGEECHPRFFRWVGGSLGSVYLLVISGHLTVMLVAWIACSLCLHQLLVLYPHREASIISARKKFVFSRLADLCLILAASLLFLHFGTLGIPGILQAAREMAGSELPWTLALAIAGIVAGAILKSAQFPFHSWLPDTLETPTPVSALMHAGIISAGGFLLIRLSPLVALSGNALLVLALIGAMTALFGSLVMLTQTSIKKSLAFSTVAQMGYMLMQCGLGAFALAALHLVAHSLYKAHAFLGSGSGVAQKSPPPLSAPASHRSPGGFAAALAVAIVICLGTGLAFGVSLRDEPGLFVLGSILIMALTTLLWNAHRRSVFFPGIALAVGTCAAYFALHHAASGFLSDALPSALPVHGPAGQVVFLLLIAAFFMVFLLQAGLPAVNRSAWGQRIYVLIFNRFYVNACVNHLLMKLWPLKKA